MTVTRGELRRPEPILDPAYWQGRLREARELHHAIFKCPLELWQKIEQRHREILQGKIGAHDSILDAGCGWGRLLTLLPREWQGSYLGLDLCPDFIDMARRQHKQDLWLQFAVGDLRDTGIDLACIPRFDWAILISIRPMINRHLGAEFWGRVERELRRVCKRLLLLEYDEHDQGCVIESGAPAPAPVGAEGGGPR